MRTILPTLGLDAQIALSIVPGVHATVFSVTDTSGVLLRPRLSLRWTF